MKSLSTLVFMAVPVAHLVAACSSAEVNNEQVPATETATEATQLPDPTHVIDGWPSDTLDLRDVVFNFKVTGIPKHVLSDDGSGFLIVQSEQTHQLAKIVYYQGQRALYRLPTHQFNIVSVGPYLICRDAAFTVLPEGPNSSEFDVEIHGADGIQEINQWARILMHERGAAPHTEKSGEVSAFCRPPDAWERFAAMKKTLYGNSGNGKSSESSKAGKVALTVLQVIVLMPLVILGAPLGSVDFGN